jgi:hypothetical protein
MCDQFSEAGATCWQVWPDAGRRGSASVPVGSRRNQPILNSISSYD